MHDILIGVIAGLTVVIVALLCLQFYVAHTLKKFVRDNLIDKAPKIDESLWRECCRRFNRKTDELRDMRDRLEKKLKEYKFSKEDE